MTIIAEIENTIGNYYNLSKNLKPENCESLVCFNDIDLEAYLAENGSLDMYFYYYS